MPIVSSGLERDKFQQRIAQILRDIVNPQIRVRVAFVDIESKVVVRIDVPKGEEPAYFADYRPYVHDLSTTRRIEPSELKNLYYEYFAASLGKPTDKTTAELIELLNQLSDVQIMDSNYADQLIKPDLYQFTYDLSSTAKKISDLSVRPLAKKLAIDSKLKELGGKLEEAESHEFYLGMQSVNEFGSKLRICVLIANVLVDQIKKNMPSSVLPNFADILNENIELLKNEWNKSERYLERGNIEKLQNAFRRFGYTFHRLGSLPDADKLGLSLDLKEIGEKLRNLSSTQKYFLMLSVGSVATLDDIRIEMNPLLTKLETITQILR